MATRMKVPDPKKALAFFESKMAFTTGPVEVDYFRKQGDQFNLIDVRAREDFEKGHAEGAVSLPQDEWNTFRGLDKNKLNILYCYTEVCHLAAKAAAKFASQGYPVMEMDGGFEAWEAHDLPVESSSSSQNQDKTNPDVAA